MTEVTYGTEVLGLVADILRTLVANPDPRSCSVTLLALADFLDPSPVTDPRDSIHEAVGSLRRLLDD